jgi:Zn-finger nucleic acid-binding protein
MKCLKFGMQLIEIDYKNIKVDKCSACQGIWLDAGKLEAVSKSQAWINCSASLKSNSEGSNGQGDSWGRVNSFEIKKS